jgi:uncharacterized protein (DUF58 family)
MVLGALALAVAGRVLGLIELYVLGAGVAALLAVGILTVLCRRPSLTASRHVEPARVHVGGESRVDLVVTNRARLRSPVVAVRDSYDRAPSPGPTAPSRAETPARHAKFLLAPIASGGSDLASYRLPADRRGRFVLGPLRVERQDAFGLAGRKADVAPAIELTVYPAVDHVVEMAPARGHRPSTTQPATTGPSGEDFATLRAYEVGDDLRQVHWPSTARLDELMIRQLDHPLEGHATVLLDVRAGVHSDETFERAISAAASLLVACSRAGTLVRLATTDGLDSGFGTGQAHLDAIMDRLAVAEPAAGDHLAGVVGTLSKSRHGGPCAFVSTDALKSEDLALSARIQSRRRPLAVVLFGGTGVEATPGGGDIERRGSATTIVRVAPSEAFAAVWNRLMARRPAGVPAAKGWG